MTETTNDTNISGHSSYVETTNDKNLSNFSKITKLSSLQKHILMWIYSNPYDVHKYWFGRDWERTLKFQMAKKFGHILSAKRFQRIGRDMRVKDSFHPTFNKSMTSLVKRELIVSMNYNRLTPAGLEVAQMLLEQEPKKDGESQ